jgi:hypothetical protein
VSAQRLHQWLEIHSRYRTVSTYIIHPYDFIDKPSVLALFTDPLWHLLSIPPGDFNRINDIKRLLLCFDKVPVELSELVVIAEFD